MCQYILERHLLHNIDEASKFEAVREFDDTMAVSSLASGNRYMLHLTASVPGFNESPWQMKRWMCRDRPRACSLCSLSGRCRQCRALSDASTCTALAITPWDPIELHSFITATNQLASEPGDQLKHLILIRKIIQRLHLIKTKMWSRFTLKVCLSFSFQQVL